jgi:hypothetical protein
MSWSRERREDRTCSIEGCPAPFYARALCKRHYYRKQRQGDPSRFAQAHSYDKYDGKGNRWCSRHKDWLPNDQFAGTKTWCRACRRFSRYKLTPHRAEALLKASQGKCPICKRREAIVIDHDHACCPGRETCGKCIRGMLCRQCNASLGTLTEKGVKRAMLYLQGKKI